MIGNIPKFMVQNVTIFQPHHNTAFPEFNCNCWSFEIDKVPGHYLKKFVAIQLFFCSWLVDMILFGAWLGQFQLRSYKLQKMAEISCFWPWCEKCSALSLSHIVCNPPGLDVFILLVAWIAKFYIFQSDCLEFGRCFVQPTVLLAPGHLALGYVKPWLIERKLKNYVIFSHTSPIWAS